MISQPDAWAVRTSVMCFESMPPLTKINHSPNKKNLTEKHHRQRQGGRGKAGQGVGRCWTWALLHTSFLLASYVCHAVTVPRCSDHRVSTNHTQQEFPPSIPLTATQALKPGSNWLQLHFVTVASEMLAWVSVALIFLLFFFNLCKQCPI